MRCGPHRAADGALARIGCGGMITAATGVLASVASDTKPRHWSPTARQPLQLRGIRVADAVARGGLLPSAGAQYHVASPLFSPGRRAGMA